MPCYCLPGFATAAFTYYCGAGMLTALKTPLLHTTAKQGTYKHTHLARVRPASRNPAEHRLCRGVPLSAVEDTDDSKTCEHTITH